MAGVLKILGHIKAVSVLKTRCCKLTAEAGRVSMFCIAVFVGDSDNTAVKDKYTDVLERLKTTVSLHHIGYIRLPAAHKPRCAPS